MMIKLIQETGNWGKVEWEEEEKGDEGEKEGRGMGNRRRKVFVSY